MSHFVSPEAVVIGRAVVARVAGVRLLAGVGPQMKLQARLRRGWKGEKKIEKKTPNFQ